MPPRPNMPRVAATLASLAVAAACTQQPGGAGGDTGSLAPSPSPPATTTGQTVTLSETPTATTPTSEPAPTPAPTAGSPDPSCPTSPPADDVSFDQALHDELVVILERDQAARMGEEDPEGDEARTERLREILAEHGWPTFDLVDEDGEDAAWAIAQHSDHDRDFQRCALDLLRIAVEAGQGSPGNLAYLSDRIAVGDGEPQRYGTQLNCGPDGPEPQTPLVDSDRIDEFRTEMDLPPWEDYLAEFDAICTPPE